MKGKYPKRKRESNSHFKVLIYKQRGWLRTNESKEVRTKCKRVDYYKCGNCTSSRADRVCQRGPCPNPNGPNPTA